MTDTCKISIFQSGTAEPDRREITVPNGYGALKALLTPIIGKLEHVAVLHDGKRHDMFVNETGVLDGLPRNEVATTIYRNNWMTMHPEQNPESLPIIAGPAVLFHNVIVWI